MQGKNTPDNLYHYCSTEAFREIVVTKSIWLSALSLSNDAMEGKLMAKITREFAQADALHDKDIGKIRELFNKLEELVDGLSFCLSEKEDLLSQWRGYAANGSGLSIGFSKEFLQTIPGNFCFGKIEYDDRKHKLLIKPIYDEFFKNINHLKQKGNEGRTIAKPSLEAAIKQLFFFKSKAFEEEAEWRLLTYFFKHSPTHYRYRTRGNSIIPYLPCAISPESNPIRRVILGPKHMTSPWMIEKFLKANKFEGVEIVPSSASYR